MLPLEQFRVLCQDAAASEPRLIGWELSFDVQDYGREWIVRATAKQRGSAEVKVSSASVSPSDIPGLMRALGESVANH